MSQSHAASTQVQEPTHHEVPIAGYAIVFGLLFILMVATIGAAEYGSEHGWNTWIMNFVAMGIAIAKASLVILYFMGVKFTTQLCKIFAIGGFVWVTLLCIMFCDYGTRHDEPAPTWIQTQRSYQTDGTLPQVGREAPRQYFGAN